MKENLLKKLKKLTELSGVSGHETEVVRFLRDQLGKIADEIEIDAMGNVFALKRGNQDGPRFMLAAHSDQIGAVVRWIDDDGFLRFERVGGTLNSLLVGRKVRVGDVFGVIGVKPGHYQTAEEKKQVPSTEELYIDVGAESREEARQLGVEIGTPVTYDDELSIFADGNHFCGAGVDDRAGCAVMWQLLEEVAGGNFAGELWAVATVQEEVGLRGAGVAAERVKPDFALALDTIPCGGTPDVSKSQLHLEIGKGPVFALVSGPRGRAAAPPVIRNLLIDTAQKHEVPHQPVIFNGGNNDAASIQQAVKGIPAGSVTLPRRYSHSPVEVGDIRDMQATVDLLKAIVNEMSEVDNFKFI